MVKSQGAWEHAGSVTRGGAKNASAVAQGGEQQGLVLMHGSERVTDRRRVLDNTPG